MTLDTSGCGCAWTAAVEFSLALAGIAARSGTGTGVELLFGVLLVVVLLVGGPKQIFFQGVQHVVQIEQLGGAEKVLDIF